MSFTGSLLRKLVGQMHKKNIILRRNPDIGKAGMLFPSFFIFLILGLLLPMHCSCRVLLLLLITLQ